MSGFYLITRGITAHHLFKGNPQRLAVWLWLLDNAAWKPTTQDVKGHTVEVPRGAVFASERRIAEECGVGYQVVRTAIKRFQSEHMINAKVTHGRTLITLCNYEKHQRVDDPANAVGNAELTHSQRNANAQKKQGNTYTSTPDGVDDGAAVDPVNADPRDLVWDSGLKWLVRTTGSPEPKCRTLIGKWMRDHQPADVLTAMRAAREAKTRDPIPYIERSLSAPSVDLDAIFATLKSEAPQQ